MNGITQRHKKYLIVLLVLLVVIVGFIWINSLSSGNESNSRSDTIVDFIQSIIDPNSNIPRKNISFAVRKLAHFFEFMVLGAILMIIKLIYKKPQIITILFISLSVGVIDEFIQSFSDRTDSVKDIILDFAGSVVGILVVYLIHRFIKTRKKSDDND